MQSATIEWGGETLELLARGALHWPRTASLLIADAHFGKGAAFRSAGIPVPSGSTESTLRDLDACLARTSARRLLILGDFFHARAGVTPSVLRQLAAWRATHETLEIVVIRGNHDLHAGDPPAALRFNAIVDEHDEGPFRLLHEPPAATAKPANTDRYNIAGHLHPAIVLRDGPNRDAIRCPCFHFAPRVAVLPAFGAFTGARAIRPRRTDRVFATFDDEICEIPPRAARRRQSPPTS